jgi:hypothetical protein
MRHHATITLAALMMFSIPSMSAYSAEVKPGETISPDNASAVVNLVSPGNLILVKQGMRMKIVPAARIEDPPPYNTATEKYSPQVRLNDEGELQNYVAGLPFPLIDANDPQVATKVMWNYSFRPQYTDDIDIRDVEAVSHKADNSLQAEHFRIGHFAFYNNIGRTEVQPIPTDPEGKGPGIRYRFGAFPFLEPEDIREFGLVRFRYTDPDKDDTAFYFFPHAGGCHVKADWLSDAIGPGAYASVLDPDSYFGFSAKIENYTYRLLGIRPMLAVVHAENVPERPCEFDNGRTVCPENWEMRQLYVVEATAKPLAWHQKIGSSGVAIPKRILYIDSEGWFVTASDQYDMSGKLWKTITTFQAYRDRPVPDAKTAIYPFKRVFQVALVDEDITTGFSTVVYMPGHDSEDHDCWYINMGIVTKSFLSPQAMLSNARGN